MTLRLRGRKTKARDNGYRRGRVEEGWEGGESMADSTQAAFGCNQPD